jgi:hypothetical protein
MLPAVLASPIAWLFGRRLIKRAEAEHRAGETTDQASSAGEVVPPQFRRDTSHQVRT